MRPEDVLPDSANEAELDGIRVRKGTVGAFVLNARVLLDPVSTDEERATAEADLRSLVPALRAVGVFDIFEPRDPRIRALIEQRESR